MALAFVACAYRLPPGAPSSLSCLDGNSVAWTRAEPDRRLDWWCARVGQPLVRNVTPSGRIDSLVVVSWNVHVGAGRIIELLELLRPEGGDVADRIGIVLLLQEAFRSGDDVPPASFSGAVPDRIRPPAGSIDVDALARQLGMAVAYVPSMRNGDIVDAREDRGTAILSTEPLTDVGAIELPFGRQRRVATSAIVHPRGGSPLRMISAHFDSVLRVEGQRRQAASLAAYLSSTAGGDPPIVLSIDTNARLGRHDRTVAAIADVLSPVACQPPVVPLRFLETDFVFSDIDHARIRSCRVEPSEYGSDHRPLVLTLNLP